MYSSVDKATVNNHRKHSLQFFPQSMSDKSVIKVHLYQRQRGAQDCGLFAIASATAVAPECDPLTIKFNQAALRPHLLTFIMNDKKLYPNFIIVIIQVT